MTFTLQDTLPASAPADGDEFGYSVAFSRDGSTIVVGAIQPSGHGKVYVLAGLSFTIQTILTASDGANGDQFGGAVAVSADGSVIAVGADSARNGSTVGHHHGAVYVYSGVSWATQTKLSSSDPTIDSHFGYSVAISDDGATIAAGAKGWTSSKGKAYVRYGASWGSSTGLVASDGVAADQFGQSISISADGSIVAVGTLGAEEAYVYSGAIWATETKIIPADPDASSFFGGAVSLSSDGLVLAVGDAGANGLASTSGKAYVYSGAGYATELPIEASDGQSNDNFGGSVALAPLGDQLVVGASNAPFSGASNGQVYIYTGGGFADEQIIPDQNGNVNDVFGGSVAFGTSRGIVVGAPGVDGGFDAGAAYVYATPSPGASITYQRIYGIPIMIDDNGVETVTQLLTSPDGFTP